MNLRVVESEGDAARPQAGDRPVIFLVDASSSRERRLLDAWIERNRPAHAEFQVVAMPASRRRNWRGRGVSGAMREAVEGGDPLLVPIRVAWMEWRKRRARRIIDVLTFGDPRDPNRLLQEIIIRFRPDRVRVVVADPAPLSDLKSTWEEVRADRPDEQFGFAEFVGLQAALSLEVAERRIRGNRYKVPRFLAEDLLSRDSFRRGLARLAEEGDEELEDLYRRCGRYLKEIAATHSTYVIDLVAALIRLLYTQGYERRIHYDREALGRIAELGQRHPVAFLPGHKSNLDHPVLTYVLYENGFPPNHTAGGINMNFFPVGPLVRRAGVFFIRREFKDNEPYKFVLKQYLDFLLSKRFPLEWFIEGGRSRVGKLREPRYGVLSYVADSYRRGSADDVMLIPTSIAYDQIQDVGSYAAEQAGGAKEKEGFGWFLRALRSMRRRYGRIYLNFGEPISMAHALADDDAEELQIPKLAFEVAVRINRATPVTPVSLVTLALLRRPDRAHTVSETVEALADVLDYVERKGIAVTGDLALDDPLTVGAALEHLVEHDVLSRHAEGHETVYSIDADRRLAAAFYRNTIVHNFTTLAVAEVSLVAATEADARPLDVFWDTVWAVRDLLKFEFFFAERDEFLAEVSAEMAFHHPGWEEAVSDGEASAVLAAVRPHIAPSVLRPIFEAYLVAATVLAKRDFRTDVERDGLVDEAMGLGHQFRLQKRVHSAEAISTVLFDTAVKLGRNRGLLEAGDLPRLEEREAFREEIAVMLARVEEVARIAGRAL